MYQPQQVRKFDLESCLNHSFSLNIDRYFMRYLFAYLFNFKIYRSSNLNHGKNATTETVGVFSTKFYYNCFQVSEHIIT